MAYDLASLSIDIRSEKVDAAVRGLRDLEGAASRAEAGIKRASTVSDHLASSIQKISVMAAGYVALDRMAAGLKAVYDSGTRLESLSRSFQGITGSVAGAAMQLDYLRQVTDKYGLSIQAAADPYWSWTAATAQSALAGEQARTVFESVAKAAGVLGMSSEQTSGTFMALTQMLGKGVVMAEELRGQFAERVPGGFAIAARSMGVTTSKLSEMLERGQVIPEEFLPKLAAEMNKTFGEPVEGAIQASNRLSNEWERLKGNLFIPEAATASISFTARIIRDLANDLELFQKFKDGRIGFGDILFLGGGKEKDDFLKSLNTVESVQKRIAEVQAKINPLTSPYERKAIEAQVQQLQKLVADMEKAAMKDPIAAAMAKAEKARERFSLLSGVTGGQQGQISLAGVEDAHRGQEEAKKAGREIEQDAKKAIEAARKQREATEAVQDKIASFTSEYPEDSAIRRLTRELRDLEERAMDAGMTIPAALKKAFEGQLSVQQQMKAYRESGLFSTGASAYDETAKRMGTGGFAVDAAWTKQTDARWNAERDLSRKLWELSASERDVALNNLEIQVAAYKAAGIEKSLVDKWWAAEAQKYGDDWVAGAKAGLHDVAGRQLSFYESARQGMVNFQHTAQGVWVQWVTTGKMSINDIKTSFLATMAEMAYQRTLGKALSAGLDLALTGIGNMIGGSTMTIDAGSTPNQTITQSHNYWSGMRAEGGPVSAGSMYLVGERGPEPFIPNTSGTIVSHERAREIFGGGGQVINISAPITVNASGGTQEQNADLAKQVGKQVRNELSALVDERLTQHLRPRGLLYGKS